MTYHWTAARDWLLSKVNSEEDIEELRDMVWILAVALDSDTIQNLFAEEMDDDGYFEEAGND